MTRDYAQPCAARGRSVTRRRAEMGEWSCREENMCDKAVGGRRGRAEKEWTKSDTIGRAGARDARRCWAIKEKKARRLPCCPCVVPGRIIPGTDTGPETGGGRKISLTVTAMNNQSSDEDNVLTPPLHASSTKRRRVQNQRACDRCRQKKSLSLSPLTPLFTNTDVFFRLTSSLYVPSSFLDCRISS